MDLPEQPQVLLIHFSLLLLDYVLFLNFSLVDVGETTDDHMNCVCQLKQRNIDTYLSEPLEFFPKLENSYFFFYNPSLFWH